MKIKVENSFSPDMKTVTFFEGSTETVYLMPEALAKSLETRLNVMWQFTHGILRDRSLVAMFKNETDRDAALAALPVEPDLYLEPFDAELI